MLTYFARRLIQAFVTLFGVAVIIFSLLHLSGDPAAFLSSPDSTPEQIEEVRQNLGFDRPLYVQFGAYLTRLANGDLGESLRFGQPVAQLIRERIGNTILLALASMFLAICIAIPAGIVAAIQRGRFLDRAVMAAALAGHAMPIFWVGLILIWIFAVRLEWLPTHGEGDLSHLILPAVTLAPIIMGRLARLVRAAMLEVLSQDYIRTARAKGVGELRVLLLHALRNAAMPLVTLVGLQLAQLLGGAIVTETIFAWPGIGDLVVQAVHNRDFPTVQGVLLISSTIFVAVNLLVDLSYAALNPRVRLGVR